MTKDAQGIDNSVWRDQTYREIAKTMAQDGQMEEALAILDKIETPDTQAMTIRGIGMALSENGAGAEERAQTFAALRKRAESIMHPPSYAIALTYISMAQAFAGDHEAAWKTAAEMENDALRHKAYGEAAEIQAEQGNSEAAMKSILFIESEAYRNKAYSHISKILADRGQFEESLTAAQAITNPYKKVQAMQTLLDAQSLAEKK
jgi:predicted negative regulator of RcsB-dependent stress response